ncbi:MAG: hypothetical protein LBQ16_00100 [Gracilibacteraceae bacterium]|jgi:hypothetical protein|nr:hypothetical protein [Gracilibacteraceae bacterium]
MKKNRTAITLAIAMEILLVIGFAAVFLAGSDSVAEWEWHEFFRLAAITYDEGGSPTGTAWYPVWSLQPVRPALQNERDIGKYEASSLYMNDQYLREYLGRLSIGFMRTFGYEAAAMGYDVLLQTEDSFVYRLRDDNAHAWQVWVSLAGARPRVAVYPEDSP